MGSGNFFLVFMLLLAVKKLWENSTKQFFSNPSLSECDRTRFHPTFLNSDFNEKIEDKVERLRKF